MNKMNYANYAEASAFELRFWLQVLGDHARFIHDSLAPSEQAEIHRARGFIQAFDGLLELSRMEMGNAEWMGLAQTSLHKGAELRAFKLHLIRRQLTGAIKLALPPSFMNHMVNEVEKFLRIAQSLASGRIPTLLDPVQLHLHWLLDASGHAAAVRDMADPAEKKWKETGEAFNEAFEQFYLKSVELAGFMRTNLKDFPALGRFNQQVELEMALFLSFLKELEEMELRHEVLGTMSPLMADHMAREECYYLLKLSWVSEVAPPACDPGKPRTDA
ncbi:DUF2935 domain-containing protein [Gorillibacterium sp. sgz5001074]|uniref:DUF2935 domain-containing protein n=1 Tax=Gorillibacterium sp. sgz5001074 TaxID=3446695 RepID=UPI003F676BF4